MMPGRDGTGPMGCGHAMGRRAGRCRYGAENAPYGYGMRNGLGFGSNAPKAGREVLLAQKERLQARLAELDKQLENA